MLTIVECLLRNQWKVDLLWDKPDEIKNIGKKLNLDIEGLNVLGYQASDINFWQRMKLTRAYQVAFWLSNGSIPALFAKNNIIHFQSPFKQVGGRKITNQFKIGLVNQIICNSTFTKQFIDKEFGVNSDVVYPPVEVDQFSQGKKEKIILAVGRYEPTKKHEALIKAFRLLLTKGAKDWKLVIIGGSLEESEDNDYLNRLKEEAGKLPIRFYVNADFSVLKEYYAKAMFFWHAKGYRVAPSKPKEMEHFGITPVEAMSAGCVPLVVDKGGLKNIVRRGEGEKWKKIDELADKTYQLINNPNKYKQYQQNAVLRSKDFSKTKFCQKINEIVEKD
jgi:glycosyltransferase involved in cell wall biosynthesis